MRIFVAIRHSLDPKRFYGALWSANFYPALKRLGHEIIESRVDLLPASRFMHIAGGFTLQEIECRAILTQAILNEVIEAHKQSPLDLVLTYFYNSHFDPAGFSVLRALGIKTCNFYCNSIYQFELVAQISAAVDFSWHPERHAQAFYLKAGARPVCVQMAADPDMYHPVGPRQIIPKGCFVGQRYADREDWLAALMEAQIPFDIYGSGWGGRLESAIQQCQGKDDINPYLGRKTVRSGSTSAYLEVVKENIKTSGLLGGVIRTGRQFKRRKVSERLKVKLETFSKGGLPQDKICETYSSYGVVLNFSNVWADGRPGSTLIPHVRLRDFEAPMCGAFYMTGHTDEIAECFEVDREIVTYQNCEELVDKVGFYLRNQEHARRIADAGLLRARSDHTWVNRFNLLFKTIL